jgi:hypothetical protein
MPVLHGVPWWNWKGLLWAYLFGSSKGGLKKWMSYRITETNNDWLLFCWGELKCKLV